MKDSHRHIYLGILFMSLASLMLETLFTRIFSLTLWTHFAFMGVSVAMLGLTIGSLVVYLYPKLGQKDRIEQQLVQTALLFAGTIPVSILVLVWIPVKDLDGLLGSIALAFQFLVLTLPFFFSGINVTLVLTRYPGSFRKLYAADLLGAALGCLVFLALAQIIDPLQSLLSVIALGFISATTYTWTDSSKWRQTLPGLILCGLLLVSDLLFHWIDADQILRSRDLSALAPDRLSSARGPAYEFVEQLLIFTLLITGAFFALPFFHPKRRGNATDLGFLAYFGLIGMGFMLIEISRLQLLNTLLRDANYSISLVLFTLLLSTAAGSYFNRRTNQRKGLIRLIVLLGVLVGSELMTLALLPSIETMAFTWRLLWSVVLLGPIGIAMGMALPLGMHYARKKRPEMSPWYWSFNGAASVFASVLAVYLYLVIGPETPYWAGSACYGLAAISFYFLARD